MVPQPTLDGQYSAFGSVVEGIEVVGQDFRNPGGCQRGSAETTGYQKDHASSGPPGPPPAFSQNSAEELAKYRAILETSLGEITLEFLPDRAANHVRNFLRLAQAGFYDGTAFHRVVRDFVAQGGLLSDPPASAAGLSKPGAQTSAGVQLKRTT